MTSPNSWRRRRLLCCAAAVCIAIVVVLNTSIASPQASATVVSETVPLDVIEQLAPSSSHASHSSGTPSHRHGPTTGGGAEGGNSDVLLNAIQSALGSQTAADDGVGGAAAANDSNPVVDGQLLNENKIETALPPMGEQLVVTLNASSKRIFNDDATSRISVSIGVLTAPALIRSRLIPLLESSLKHETDVHIFFKDDPVTIPGRELLRDYLHSVQRTDEVHIVPLAPIRNMKASLRNAWVNLPAIQYFHVARPHQKWFAIMDDDTYFLMNAVRRMLREVDTNASHVGKPVYMGTPLTDGVSGGCRVIRTGNTLRVQRTTTRKEVHFVCGGSGILMDRLAINSMFVKNATGFDYIDQCMDTMFQGAGDVRLGHCLSELNVTILPRRQMFRDTMFRALGETRVYNKYDFPVSFHRFRRREWQYALRAVEDKRDRNELVTWGDLLKNFRPGPTFWPSMFFPKAYENYTKIYGIRVKTPHELRRDKIICKRFQCCRKEVVEEW